MNLHIFLIVGIDDVNKMRKMTMTTNPVMAGKRLAVKFALKFSWRVRVLLSSLSSANEQKWVKRWTRVQKTIPPVIIRWKVTVLVSGRICSKYQHKNDSEPNILS